MIARTFLSLLVLASVVAGRETSIDPATGRSQTSWTLPLTSANADRAVAQWQQCTRFRSESYCARNLPGGRPPSVAGASPADYGEMIDRPNDP